MGSARAQLWGLTAELQVLILLLLLFWWLDSFFWFNFILFLLKLSSENVPFSGKTQSMQMQANKLGNTGQHQNNLMIMKAEKHICAHIHMPLVIWNNRWGTKGTEMKWWSSKNTISFLCAVSFTAAGPTVGCRWTTWFPTQMLYCRFESCETDYVFIYERRIKQLKFHYFTLLFTSGCTIFGFTE